jgi:hypothetical protein
MPATIFGPYDFLNFNGKLFSRKHKRLMFVKFPGTHSRISIVPMGDPKENLYMIYILAI